MNNYQHLIKKIITENTTQEDGKAFIELRETRSGDCASVFGHFMEWDLRKGFPAVTTKKLQFETVMGELLFFLNGSCDRRTMQELQHGDFLEDRWDIWKQDCERAAKENPYRFNGYNLGEMYPEMWRNKRITATRHVEITPREDLDKDYEVVGEPTVQGVGINDMKGLMKTHPKIYRLWQDMLIRCYGNRDKHKATREKGVTVSPRWHMLSNFYKDVYSLSGFQDWVSDPSSYDFDKDYFGGKVYSRNTCIFLESSINKALNGGGQGLRIFKVGDKVLFGLTQLAEHFDTYRQNDVVGRLKARGEEFEEVFDTDTKLYRPQIFVDQFANMIEEIKNNKEGRYKVVDSWNTQYKEKAVLGACHQMFQVYVTDKDELDLMWHQRSVDTFLGLPFNIASYAALAHIIAKLTGKRVRYLKCSLGDVHLYYQHLGQAFEILERTPFPSPRLSMPEFTCLNDLNKLTAKDFKLRDYAHCGVLKGKLTVGDSDELSSTS